MLQQGESHSLLNTKRLGAQKAYFMCLAKILENDLFHILVFTKQITQRSGAHPCFLFILCFLRTRGKPQASFIRQPALGRLPHRSEDGGEKFIAKREKTARACVQIRARAACMCAHTENKSCGMAVTGCFSEQCGALLCRPSCGLHCRQRARPLLLAGCSMAQPPKPLPHWQYVMWKVEGPFLLLGETEQC